MAAGTYRIGHSGSTELFLFAVYWLSGPSGPEFKAGFPAACQYIYFQVN